MQRFGLAMGRGGLARVGASAVVAAGLFGAAPVWAEDGEGFSGGSRAGASPQTDTAAGDGALQELLNAARDGSGDPHLPYVLVRLKQALGEQDVIGFLNLVDPKYFMEQFGLLSKPDRSPGEAMAQFSCEFFSLCDVAKRYKFADVVSMRLVAVGRMDTPLDKPVEVKIEMQMWDGVLVPATIFYNRRTYRLSSASG